MIACVAQRKRVYVIKEKKQLAVLVSPVRQEIADVLAQMGTASVVEIAAALGRPADALYYHLRALKQSGLVLHAGSRASGRRREELFRTVAPDMMLHYDLKNRGNARSVTAIVGSMLRLGIRDFRRTFENGNAAVSGAGRELWALRQTGWLLRQEVVRMNKSIERLKNTVSKRHRGGRLYAITVLLTPLDHQARKSSTARISQAEKKRSS
jgi:DNA-binding transcriptional ArsR family regulator